MKPIMLLIFRRVIASSSSCSDAPGSGAESMTTVSESCSDDDSVSPSRPKRRKVCIYHVSGKKYDPAEMHNQFSPAVCVLVCVCLCVCVFVCVCVCVCELLLVP